MSKHNISSATSLFYGGGYDAPLYAANRSKGVPVCIPTKVSLGSPVAPDDDIFIDDATSTELPNNATKTYTTANTTSPCDNGSLAALVATITTSTGTSASVWTMDVPRNIVVGTSTAVAATVTTVTGYDVYGVKMVEAITIALGGSSGAGKKAFKHIESIAIYSAGDITTDTLTVGFGDVLGLPYKLASKGDLISASFNGINEAVAALTAAVTSTATATTGDVRGTVDMTSASDGSPIVVWMYVADPSTAAGLRGVDQYGG